MRLYHSLIRVCIALLLLPLLSFAGGPGTYFVKGKGISIELSSEGKIIRIISGKNAAGRPVQAFTRIAGWRQMGNIIREDNKGGGLQFRRTLVSDSLHQMCTIIEKFIPTKNSIRWELEIIGTNPPSGSEIITEVLYPATTQTRFWTTWGSPQYDADITDQSLKGQLTPVPGGSDMNDFIGAGNNQWVDPLVAVPFSDVNYFYGLPHYADEDPRLAICPFQGNIIAIPMCSILEPSADEGITIALSPADDIIDMEMNTTKQGGVSFSRLFNRMDKQQTLRFSLDITAHAADWRAGFGWMAHRYPDYFLPKNKQAHQLAGTSAYAGPFEVIDTDKMKALGFSTNWQASFDFPYMGMFLPPVDKNTSWKRFGDSTISIARMNAYARQMKKNGFHVLNYFNVTEFGAKVKFPPATYSGAAADLWKDGSAYLYQQLPNAWLKVPQHMNLARTGDDRLQKGGPIYTWEDGVVMDCGDPAYKAFLLEQAQRHILNLPDADGFCIDRLDWLRMFNEDADDGKTWFNGKPARSLLHSFKALMDTMGPMMHHSNKMIFVNNHNKRIDLLNEVDGIYDEFTYAGAPLNLSAFLSVEKPALGWTDKAATVKKEGADNFFQKYLYMGVFPMCPYPANDHSIMPDSLVDSYYREYAPLMHLMRGREWVLKPHVVVVLDNLAKANLFKTPEGYVIPVVYGKTKQVSVTIKSGLKIGTCEVWYPGKSKGMPLQPTIKGDQVILEVPLERGCAMVSIMQ